RAEARSKTSPTGKLRSSGPSPDRRKTTAAGRSPGLWVIAWRTSFPVSPEGTSQWLMVRGSPLTVAGAARALTRFPLNPQTRNLSRNGPIQVSRASARGLAQGGSLSDEAQGRRLRGYTADNNLQKRGCAVSAQT